MKRLFSVVLIIACLGLCACKPKEKDKESKVNDKINPAFYSEETLVNWCEENDVANFNVIDINGLGEFYDERLITRDMLEEWLSSVIGDKKMVYSCGSRGNAFVASISDVPALYCISGPDLWKKYCYSDDMEVGGLHVEIMIKEDYEVSDEYDSFEEYLKEGPHSRMHGVLELSGFSSNFNAENWDNVIEVSDLTYARYYTDDVCYPKFPRLYYGVELVSFDSESGNYVEVRYIMPVEDNEDEIQELRDLGIPVITDFIK